MKKTIDFMSKSSKWLLVFGIVFSQLAFPLGVLADEVIESNEEENALVDTALDNENVLENEEVVADDNAVVDDAMNNVPEEGEEETIEETTDEPIVAENIVTINGEVTDNYVINPGDNTSVSIAVDGEEKISFNFNCKLYGTYQYTVEGIEKTVTIEYVGNNADILKKYEVGTDLSKKIRYDASNCVIAGFGKDIFAVNDIKAYYDLEAFMAAYDASVIVTRDGVELADEDSINANDKLEIVAVDDAELVRVSGNSSYTINRLGDIYVDNIIDRNDQELVLDDVIRNNAVNNFNDINGDGILDILDATDSLFITNDGSVPTTDTLKSVVEVADNEAVIGEEVKVSLKVSGFTNTSLYGIEGLINYDDSILELVGANINGTNSLGYLNLENNRFAYVFDGFNNNDEALLVLTFKVIASGDVDVTISNLVASYGARYNLENDTTTVSLTVLDYGKGGDVDDNNAVPATTVNTDDVVSAVAQVVNTVNANNDNADTYSEDKEVEEKSKATKKDKKKDSDEEETEKSSTSKTIIIILIILVIIGLIYVIFKDDEEENAQKPENKVKPNEKANKKNNKK